MGRLVRVPRQTNSVDMSISGMVDGMLQPGMEHMPHTNVAIADNFLERVAKYVPAEVLAFSLFINSILDQAVKTGGRSAMMAGFPVTSIAIGALVVGAILTPFFVWYVREDGDAWITNALVSTLLFPFWAYAMGAVAFADYRDGNLAAILLATVTVVSGLVSPRAKRPPKAEKQSVVVKDRERERPHLLELETA